MTLEQIEVQIADLLTKARKVQIKAQQLQRQGVMVAMQSEVAVREKFNEYLEGGLTILGKGIVKGRKIKEALVAETHRKSASLKKAESRILKPDAEPIAKPKKFDSKFTKSSANVKPHKQQASSPAMKKMKPKARHSTHPNSAAARIR